VTCLRPSYCPTLRPRFFPEALLPSLLCLQSFLLPSGHLFAPTPSEDCRRSVTFPPLSFSLITCLDQGLRLGVRSLFRVPVLPSSSQLLRTLLRQILHCVLLKTSFSGLSRVRLSAHAHCSHPGRPDPRVYRIHGRPVLTLCVPVSVLPHRHKLFLSTLSSVGRGL